ALGGKPNGERKGLGLPGLGKDRTALVARERGQRSESVAIGLQVRHDRGSCPTCQCKQNRAARRHLPIALELKTEPNTRAAVARPENARLYLGTRRYRGGGR